MQSSGLCLFLLVGSEILMLEYVLDLLPIAQFRGHIAKEQNNYRKSSFMTDSILSVGPKKEPRPFGLGSFYVAVLQKIVVVTKFAM